MNRATTAVLLSALVFPGAGHLYLKRPLRACVFLAPALAATLVLAGDAIGIASKLADEVLAGRLLPDPLAIAARIEAQGAVGPLASACAVVLLVAWAASIADSFALGRRAG